MPQSREDAAQAAWFIMTNKLSSLFTKKLFAGHRARRLSAVVASAAVIVAVFLLAASLNSLELAPGESFELPMTAETAPGALRFGIPPVLFDAFLVLAGIAVLISLVMLLRSPQDRRALLRNVGLFLVYMAIGLLVTRLYNPPEEQEVTSTPGAHAPSPVSGLSEGAEYAGTPVPVTLEEPKVAGWVRYAVTLAVVGLIAAFGYWMWRSFHTPQEELHEITRSALDDLLAGRNWEDVVIQCYADMSATIKRQRGVGRHEAMTAREFAARLEQLGLPAGSVSRLTRLFEQARYGSRESTPGQVQEATECLAEIMRAVAGS